MESRGPVGQLLTVADAQALWEPAGVYCNAASYGLPPRPAWDALQSALADWHGGRMTSVLFPLLVQRRLDVRTVPLAELVDSVLHGAHAVAFSAVRRI